MRSTDTMLVGAIKEKINWLLEQQKLPNSHYHTDARQLLVELHGPLIEMSDLDKEDNTTLIDFIIALLYARKNRTHEETLALLEDLSSALASMLKTPDGP